MANSRNIGALRERMEFQARATADDGFGNQIPAGPFETRFTYWAGMRPLRGSEAVMAARLDWRQPYVVTVRNTTQTRGVTVAWQLVDARNANRVFAITSPPADPDGKNAWLEFIVTEGAAS